MVAFPPLKNIVVGTIAGFFIIQILSILISSLFPSVPLIRGGMAILLMLLAIGIIALFNIGFNFEKFDRLQLVFVLIVFLLIGAGYYFLPQRFPGLFSISPDVSSAIKNSIASIISLGGG
ncbi:MAG: hypothetical protein AABY22_12145 [Nanoarchaeota archaeon]